MIFLFVVLVVVAVPLAVLRFGADSRDGRDWKPLCGFDSDDNVLIQKDAVRKDATVKERVLVRTGQRII